MSEIFPGEVGSSIESTSTGHPLVITSFMLKAVLGLLLFVTAVLPYFLDEKTNPAMLALLVSGLAIVLYHKTLVEEKLLLARGSSSLGDNRGPSVALLFSTALFGLTIVLQLMSMMIRQKQECDPESELGTRYTFIAATNCGVLFLAILLVVAFDQSYLA